MPSHRPQSPPAAGPAVRRRLRHVLNFGVHGLTSTPHKDEVLQASAGGLGRTVDAARDDSALAKGASRSGTSLERSTLKQRSLDDLDLVEKGRRRGTSAGSANSLRIPPTSPSLRTSPSLPPSSSFGSLPSTSPSTSHLPRRPSLSRHRNSSRLSIHGPPPSSRSHSTYGLADDLTTSPVLSPTLSRYRSRSIGRLPASGDGSLRPGGLGFVNEKEPIEEAQEDTFFGPLPSSSEEEGVLEKSYFALEEERDRALKQAGERLLESFVALRFNGARAAELWLDRPGEAGPSGRPSTERDRIRSKEEERKGKYRACVEDASAEPSSPPTDDSPPGSLDAVSSPNPNLVPFHLSRPHRPSTHPRFTELSSGGRDFAPWAVDAGVGREESVGVELWTRARRRSVDRRREEEGEWRVLKVWEDVRFNDLTPWDGQTPLAPNTLTVRFAAEPEQTFYLAPAVLSAAEWTEGGRLKLERVVSEPDVHKGRKVVEWGGAEEAILRSLRETRMKAGVGVEDLERLLQAQAGFQTAERDVSAFRTTVDGLVAEVDEVARLRRQVSEIEGSISYLNAQQEEVKRRKLESSTEIARAREDIARRRNQLAIGHALLEEERTKEREFNALIELERSLRADAGLYLTAARASRARDLEAIFPIVPVANGRAQPIFTVVSVALPLPSLPKEPAPPLQLPSSQLPPGITVDEENVAAAFGHVALLLDRLAGYLGLRLPYPFTCAGSRSLVKDPISDIAGPTRLFPLYSKGIERYRFEYAVFLLNKNLELLMVHRGLRIMDFRHTLPNLMNLLLTLSSDRPLSSSSRDLPRPSHLRTSSTSGNLEDDEDALSRTSTLRVLEDETESESELAHGDEDEDGSGDRTPKASSDGSRGLFWGLGGGGSGGSSSSKATIRGSVSEKTKLHRSRRGTLIARAFVGQGSASKEHESGTTVGPPGHVGAL